MNRWLRTVAHVPPSMLWARLRLKCKRAVLERLGPRRPFDPTRAPEGGDPALREHPPAPVFPPRTRFCRKLPDGRFEITFLNEARTFSLPFDWHPPELARGTRLWKLHLHYMEFLESLGDADWGAVIADWIGRNRPYHRGYWLDDWNSYAMSIRAVVWMQQWARRGAPRDAAFRRLLLGSLADQMDFLRANLELDIRGNHLIKNVKALMWGGRFFAGERGERCYRLGAAHLRRELAEQILPDGMHFERSPAYHAQVHADLLECLAVARPAEREALAQRLPRMAAALRQTTQPDGRPSLFNDGGLEMAYSPAEILEAQARLLPGSVPEPAADTVLAHAGYYGRREGDDWLLVDAGKVAPDYLMAHAHGDILSFEWSRGDRRIVVDPGVFEYDPGPAREASRATASHNTVTVGGESQCEFWGSFRCGRRARVRVDRPPTPGGPFAIEASHDGFAWMPGAPVHRRRLAFAAGSVRVEDSVVGGAGQKAEAALLFHPGFRWEPGPGGGSLTDGILRVRLETGAPVRAEAAAWSPEFGLRLPCVRLVLDYGPVPCRNGFRLAVTGAADPAGRPSPHFSPRG